MKKTLLALTIMFGYANAYSQCTPDTYYQDSTYGIWPDTIQNLSTCVQNVNYHEEITIKTPATLIEASGGDSSITQLDTVVMGVTISENLAAWPVDSMNLVGVDGLPNGLLLSCAYSNCVLPGDVLTCASVDGTTSDPIGVYPITIWVDVFTHGVLDLGLIQYPLSTSLSDATGSYESLTGYKIVVSNTSSYEMFNSNEFSLLQNIPNPSDGNTKIMFNTPNAENVILKVVDMFGKCVVSKEISSVSGLNTINLSKDLSSGIYNYSVQVNDVILTKRMIITK
jgi:hypothetical protein